MGNILYSVSASSEILNTLQQRFPRLSMTGLDVPVVQVLTDLGKECVSEGFSSDSQNASREIEELKDVDVLAACEGARYSLVDAGLIFCFHALGGKEDVLYVELPALVESAFKVGEREVRSLTSTANTALPEESMHSRSAAWPVALSLALVAARRTCA